MSPVSYCNNIIQKVKLFIQSSEGYLSLIYMFFFIFFIKVAHISSNWFSCESTDNQVHVLIFCFIFFTKSILYQQQTVDIFEIR